MSEAIAELKPTLQSAGKKIQDGATQIQDGAVEFKDAVLSKGSEMISNCRGNSENLIRNNPYRSVMIAFGVGALASLLLLPRRK